MSLSPKDPRDHLLADTLHDDWASGPASAMARRAAVSARRHLLVRRGAVALGTAVAFVTLLSFILRREQSARVTSETLATLAREATQPASSSSTAHTQTSAATVAASTPSAKTPGYEIVSDEEFFALLRDRPLLVLPEEKGPKKFIVLAY